MSDERDELQEEPSDSQAYDASNPGKVGEREKRARERAIRIKDGFRHVLENANSRAWLWELISDLRPLASALTTTDPVGLAHNVGRQSVGLQLLGQLTTPEHIQYFNLMIEESKK